MDHLMHRRNRILLPPAAACLLALAAPLAALADAKPAAAPAAAQAAPSPSYSAGLQVGEGMHRAGFTTEIDVDAFARGLKDALAGKVSTPEDRDRLNQFIAEIRNNVVTRNHTAAREFLAKNAGVKGVVTTASGLQYKILEAGDAKAASPGPSDKVTVQYRGTLIDGTEFDSSYARGTPASFQVNGVIKGWQEALVLMKPGAKWQLFVPPELGYDANSRPPIPPGSLLLFDVELVSVGAAKD
jgi:FKBP-type peptidyl-prolyl cis-trans isomerase FklB